MLPGRSVLLEVLELFFEEGEVGHGLGGGES
jgi:hypothetical protein